MNKKEIIKIVKIALQEDIGSGDITTNLIVSNNQKGFATIYAKEDGIVAGLFVARLVFKTFDDKIIFKALTKDGNKISCGEKLAEIKGNLKSLLTGERVALNFLQRMSGIATITSKFVKQLEGTNTRLLDTRKTAPCLRMLDKYSVKIGGGTNHRFGLYDMVLIKDNHIKTAGSITKAVTLVKSKLKNKIKIEVETTSLEEVKEALANKIDIIMLDNMSIDTMKEAIKLINGKVKTEASGNITLENIREIALTGVDFISVGALTHSVKALDISMKIENV
ncbi:carboxylating nicotinate-nucleotide diphosphorylase [Stygiobacter electus]|uniref:Probable nicotinate-nucleotide pyrophosphorylase [carboxylating] n=1 Tax=Stygiobacter electus TaxID=3032292 RepID=A0AAE3NYV1_9BACT|nr:carboxylating nicotinate-nucleotide diphosphorylase [Stygiobacter electus]MDF1612576.1 carboxylating nicotinate-nucleotide diphosphorylase [Stygiobacter electus]